MDHQKYLRDLGLDPDGKHTPEELKAKWRELCQEHHPDKGGDSEEFRKVMHAYKMLTDLSYQHEQKTKDPNYGKNLDLRISVPISFEDAFFGRRIVLSYNRIHLDEQLKPIVSEEQDIVTLTRNIPPGAFPSHEWTSFGHGVKCGEETGDTIMSFRPLKHPRFEFQDGRVVSHEKFPLDLMLKGGSSEVITMWGVKTLEIPIGTAPGTPLEIPDAGLMKKYPHIVIVEPIYPSKEDLKGTAWKGLEIDWAAEEKKRKEDNTDAEFEQLFRTRFSQGGIFFDNLGEG